MSTAPNRRTKPVEAIFFEDDVPNEWADFRRADREFFTELGSPGGASNIGPVDSDHAVVAELPDGTALTLPKAMFA